MAAGVELRILGGLISYIKVEKIPSKKILILRFFLYEKVKKGSEIKGTQGRFLPFFQENSRILAREITFLVPQKKDFYFHRKITFFTQK